MKAMVMYENTENPGLGIPGRMVAVYREVANGHWTNPVAVIDDVPGLIHMLENAATASRIAGTHGPTAWFRDAEKIDDLLAQLRVKHE